MSRPLAGRCKKCRFWSQYVAQSTNDGQHIEALCLYSKGNIMMNELGGCNQYRPNTFGTIDKGERVRNHYYLTEGPKGIGQDSSTD